MRACAEQFITLGNIPNASIVVRHLSAGLNTNLSAANIAWFIRQALQCSSEDVHFYTMPCDQSMLQGYSYAIPRLGQWLEMVNTYLNPYDTPVTASNVDIVYRNGQNYAATTGLQGAWYYEDPGPAPVVTPTPTEEPRSDGPTIIQVTPKPPETVPPIITPGPEPVPGAAQEPAAPSATSAPGSATAPAPAPRVTAAPDTDETPDFALRLGA